MTNDKLFVNYPPPIAKSNMVGAINAQSLPGKRVKSLRFLGHLTYKYAASL
ncbi:hypothetical protein COO91_05241 [Nostoc flagelliforme CCNUN1]|uniref:Uncharacterized protein n=1 Tax=Nostoc flagelliforme CCNUN1 TaxID=2038116 RepID=A0A2K8SUW1_9NOSO|nr:hypothetical protein COO91_05241 [Nostoc flagelliforme CCNUN1]